MVAQYKNWHRILSIYERFNKEERIDVHNESQNFGVNIRTIQRDITDLKAYIHETYNLIKDGEKITPKPTIKKISKTEYILLNPRQPWLKSEEALTIAKILLDSRAFPKKELEAILDKILLQTSPVEREKIEKLIANEKFHYKPISTNATQTIKDVTLESKPICTKIRELYSAISEQKLLEIIYKKEKLDKGTTRVIEPLGIIFSEYYFYLIAYIHDDKKYEFPAIYRVDRIKYHSKIIENGKEKTFEISKRPTERFKEGEFREKIQFMKAGQIIKIRFLFWGDSVEAMCDRLPTARKIKQKNGEFLRDDGKYELEAEVFGKGIKMWLLSQAQYLEVIEPKEFRKEMKETIEAMLGNYVK